MQRSEEVIKQSRFIVSIEHAPGPGAAKAFIERCRMEFPDASHNCFAFLAASPADTTLAGSSDDGEPRGTAGRPMLNVLTGSGLGEIVAVVTRYFGGIKLGTGGLVRAYSGALANGLAILPQRWHVDVQAVRILFGHHFVTPITRLVDEFEGTIAVTEYGMDAEFIVHIPLEYVERFTASVKDITHGDCFLEQLDAVHTQRG
ncbi:IMPACT family protein [Desulfovibrio inopinatus]|uniref:IMPACT family protein n=1 Tax=Desulfovibrio inopinatus TaxID=102109 RepID=UPI001FE1E119|nr:YigZ family protein [Desulfovibrio inopinatus]